MVVDNPEQLLGSKEAQGQPWLGVTNSQAAPHPSLVTDPPQVDQSDYRTDFQAGADLLQVPQALSSPPQGFLLPHSAPHTGNGIPGMLLMELGSFSAWMSSPFTTGSALPATAGQQTALKY